MIASALADPFRRFTGIWRGAAVLIAALLIVGLVVLFGWIAMPQSGTQGAELIRALPDSLDELDRMLAEGRSDEECDGLIMEAYATMVERCRDMPDMTQEEEGQVVVDIISKRLGW